jgi:hypothetical protein
MVVVQVFDLSGQIPLGFRKVHPEILRRAEELAQARGSVQAQGLVRVSLQDLDLAEVQGTEWEWAEVEARESALPKGYRLDAELGLVRDFESAQVVELD